jgi:hypothetical protein
MIIGRTRLMNVTTKESPSFGSNGTAHKPNQRELTVSAKRESWRTMRQHDGVEEDEAGCTDKVLGDDVDERERSEGSADLLEDVPWSDPTKKQGTSEER